MTTWVDVYVLSLRIPARLPRGSPENKLRNTPIQRWLAAKRRYETESGLKWRQPNKPLNEVLRDLQKQTPPKYRY